MIEIRTLGTIDVRRDDGTELPIGQSKRLALLAYLAVARPPGFHRRDVLLAIFWPELPDDAGRRALRQAVHYLRRLLGPEAIPGRGEEAIGLDAGRVRCDAATFDVCMAEGRLADALALYRGDLLPGLYVQGAPAVERWIDEMRADYRAAAARAARTLAESPALPLAERVEYARRGLAVSPFDEAALRRLMRLAADAHDPGGALRAYETFARDAASELGMGPSAETRALAERIQASAARVATTPNGRQPRPRHAAEDGRPGEAAPIPAGSTAAPTPTHDTVAPAAGGAPVQGRPGRLRRRLAWATGMAAMGMLLGLGLQDRAMPDLTAVGGLLAPSGEDARRILATRLFTEGLRALDRGNRAGARQLFESSLAEDSTNSLAAYYVAAANDDFAAYPRLFARAVRLAMHDTDERRLLVQGLAAFASDEPRAAAIAETLAIRYPRNADGQLLVGKTRIQRGDFVGAVGPLRQAIVLDSVALRSDAMRCVACEAYSELAGAYDSADSAAAAERVAREWIAARPRSGAAWDRLAYRLEVRGAWDEARAALDRKAAIEGTGERDLGHAAEALMRAGRYREADALLLPRLATAALDRRADVLWLLTISYRNQGRLGEALAAAREFRRLAPRLSDEGAGTVLQGYLEALVLMDGGAPERAAALFDSIAHQTLVRSSVARQGRHMATNHAHRATALALAGDTLALRALVDTVRVEGARSGYARDQRLHHYVRGLLLEARGDHAGALRAYRASMYSPLGGWVRSNVAYARTAMRLGRPRDAVWALGGAIRGPFGASGLWYSRPEIHRLLANAWSAAGRPDSAAVHRAAAGPSRPANATAAR